MEKDMGERNVRITERRSPLFWDLTQIFYFWQFVTDVSGKPIGYIFKEHSYLIALPLKMGPIRFSQNVANKIQI
jgi:hypothetical protein